MSRKDTPNALPITGKRKKDPNERIRKVGEREEVIDVKLTEVQRDEQRHLVMSLLDQADELEERKKEVVKNYASQIAGVELQIHAARQLANNGKRRETITIEEWLTGGNDIVRIRADTGEQLGDARRARADELQERLFPDAPPQNDASGPPPPPPDGEFPDAADAFADDP